MDEKILKLNDELIQEAQMRQKGDEANRDKLEEASTGGVYISLFGAYLLFLGVILSTLAPEIYTFRLR